MSLTDKQNRKIEALSFIGTNSQAIANEFEKRKNAVQNYVKSPATHEVKKSSRRPQRVTLALTRR